MTPPGSVSKARRRRVVPLLVLCGGLAAFAGAGFGLRILFEPAVLRVAVGPDGSDDAKIVQALAGTFERERYGVRLVPVATGSGAESVAALAAGRADMAVARADLPMPAEAQAVAIMRKNLVVLWAPARPAVRGRRTEPRVRAISDLAGRRVGIVGRGAVNVTLLSVILKESGVDPASVETVQFPVDGLAAMARDASLSAYMAVGPLTSRITSEALADTARARGEPKFLPVDVADAIAERHPLYESEEIPQAAFGASPARPGDKIDSVAVDHLIVVRGRTSDAAVGGFVHQLFAVRRALQRELPGMADIRPPDTDKAAALPAHRAAAAYVDGTERTFLEKYSDYLWGGVFLLSGLGSAAAWLRGYLRRDRKAEALSLRGRLLAMCADAPGGGPEALSRLRREADGIVGRMFALYDEGVIDADDLAAFGIALERFERAAGVSERSRPAPISA